MEFVDSISAPGAATASALRSHRPDTSVSSPARTHAPSGADGASTAPARGSESASRHQYENGQPVWRVRCGDLIDRGRCVTVFVEHNQVVLVGPPGETARMTTDQLGQLRAALNEAAKLAER